MMFYNNRLRIATEKHETKPITHLRWNKAFNYTIYNHMDIKSLTIMQIFHSEDLSGF